jgi:hypothetical protein
MQATSTEAGTSRIQGHHFWNRFRCSTLNGAIHTTIITAVQEARIGCPQKHYWRVCEGVDGISTRAFVAETPLLVDFNRRWPQISKGRPLYLAIKDPELLPFSDETEEEAPSGYIPKVAGPESDFPLSKDRRRGRYDSYSATYQRRSMFRGYGSSTSTSPPNLRKCGAF